MKELFKYLAWTCYINNLKFEYTPTSGGLEIYSTDRTYELITIGYLKNWHKDPYDVLVQMEYEVDNFIRLNGIEDETRYVKRQRGITWEEQAMKEAGHKLSDFE